MSLEILKNDLAKNQIPPVYFWYGEDRYSLAEALNHLKEFFRAEDPSGSAIEVFSGEDTVVLSDLIAAANTASFFSRRLVVFDNIPYFKQDKASTSNGEEEEKNAQSQSAGSEGENLQSLLEYLENPNPATCLVLTSEKANRGRKLYKALDKAGTVLQFTYPKQHEWLKWVQTEVKTRGKRMGSPTASFLLEWVGHHTGILSAELDKLTLYTGNKQDITKEDIEAVCVPLIETKVFDMLDAIASAKTGEALHKLKEVLSQEYHLKVHTMIVRQIRLLLAASILRGKGETVEKLMEIARLKPFEGNKIYRQAVRFSPGKLAEALEECLETELALKNSGGNPHLLLEMMVIRFCQK